MHYPPVFPTKAKPGDPAQQKIDYRARDAYDNRVLRWTSDMMSLWGLCANAKCRRARQCRGDPSDCVTQYREIVPEDVHESATLLRQAIESGKTFDKACEEYPDEMEELDEWFMSVMASADKAVRV